MQVSELFGYAASAIGQKLQRPLGRVLWELLSKICRRARSSRSWIGRQPNCPFGPPRPAESQLARSRRPAWLGAYSFSAVSTEGFMGVALGLTAASGVTLMPR
jgi:hypothetical protein